jgi:hypothetical protein
MIKLKACEDEGGRARKQPFSGIIGRFGKICHDFFA